MSAPADITARTFRLDLSKATLQGIVETAGQTFFVLIAVKALDAGPTIKSLLVISGPLGLLLNPLGLWLVRSCRWSAARGAATFNAAAACGFLAAALPGPLWQFAGGCMLGAVGMTLAVPLMTQIYQNNYPREKRGRLFSMTVIPRVLMAALFSWLGGMWLEQSIERYRWVVLAFAAAAAGCAWFISRMPSRELSAVSSMNPLHGWRHVRRDGAFRWLLISWMLLGLGNLMMLPLRVDYVANPDFGIQLPANQAAMLTGVIPAITMLVLSPFWGPVFDRYNFYVLRFFLNLSFIGGMLCHFIIGGMPGFVAGSLCFGIAMSGGNVAWSLWVTKIAKPDDVAEYMSVHTALAGLRGVIAPAAGFWLAGSGVDIPLLAWLAIALIAAGTVVLAPETTTLRRRRPGQPVVPRSWD